MAWAFSISKRKFTLRPPLAADDEQMVRQVLDSRKGHEYLIRTLLMPHLGEMYEDLLRATEGADFLACDSVERAMANLCQPAGAG